jgi:hypothetical protein
MVNDTAHPLGRDSEATTGPPRDPSFNPFRAPRTDRARALVREVAQQVGAYEEASRVRQRKRRSVDQANHDRAIEAVVCDVVHRHLLQPGQGVAQPLSDRYRRKSRYRSPILGNFFSDLLQLMATPELGFIELEMGHIDFFNEWNRATTFRAGERLARRAEEFDIDREDFCIHASEETIILKYPKDVAATLRDDRQEYEDTDITRQYRAEVARINAWLESADIACDAEDAAAIDVTDRRLRRIFNGSFERGGRLFGGFWMNMKKRYRADLWIDECSVVVPDYSQMMATTLYAMAGHGRPARDAYTISGYEAHREAFKKLFAAMVHSTTELRRFPEDLPETLTRGRSYAEVSEAVLAAHAPIRDFFYRGMGMEAMFHESNILIDVLLHLVDRGITALPIHDAVIVAKVDLKVTVDTMKEAFKDRFGFHPNVTLDGGV